MGPFYYKSCWETYISSLKKGNIPTKNQARFIFSTSVGLNFQQDGTDDLIVIRREARHLAILFNLKKEIELEMHDSEELRQKYKVQLGIQFVDSVANGDMETFKRVIASGFDVNFVHPEKGNAAIHPVAHRSSGFFIHEFLKAQEHGVEIDYLLKNRSGEVPSQIARRAHGEKFLVRFWETMEKRQATRQGLNWNEYTARTLTTPG